MGSPFLYVQPHAEEIRYVIDYCKTEEGTMAAYIMTETERLLAELIWEKEPVRSGELVKLASQRFGWRKSTTYKVLRKICEKDIFQNQAAVVTAKITREEYTGSKKKQNLQENHKGSLQNVAAALLKRKKRNNNDIKELVKLIGEQEK